MIHCLIYVFEIWRQGAISANEVSIKVVPISMIFTLWTQKWENSEFMKLNKVGFLCKFCITWFFFRNQNSCRIKEIWCKGFGEPCCLLSKPSIYVYISSWCVYFVTGLSYVLQQPLTARQAKTKADIVNKSSHSCLSCWVKHCWKVIKIAKLFL